MAPRFPFEAVRDLLGILRAMYAEERSKTRPSSRRLASIERTARELRNAMRLAENDPERAHARAEAAVLRLPDLLLDVLNPLEPVLRAAGNRVRGKPTRPSERAMKWAVGKLRS